MEFNKHNTRAMIGLIVLALMLWAGLQNYRSVLEGIAWAIGLFFPFIIGGCMAFIINIPMAIFERTLFNKRWMAGKPRLQKMKRPISLLLALFAIILLLCVVSFLIVPEFTDSVLVIKDAGPAFIKEIQGWINSIQGTSPDITNFLTNLSLDWTNIEAGILGFLQKGVLTFLDGTVDAATSIAGGVLSFFIGIIFAIYALFQKETLGRQFRKILYAYVPEKVADRVLFITDLSSKTFGNFVTGQCTEAVIIGGLFFITMSIFRFPYALMISVLIGFLSLIPIFGAFIGCVLGAFLILMNSPIQAFWFIVLFLVVQQLEGNLIYPHVVGGSVGLPSIWVLVAVTIGGNGWGIVGMIITIPLCSVFYTLLREEVASRLRSRQIERNKLTVSADETLDKTSERK